MMTVDLSSAYFLSQEDQTVKEKKVDKVNR